MITHLRAQESTAGHTIRAWTGPATDEGVGLISMIEVWDASGRPVCRFELFLGTNAQDTTWPRDEHEACRVLEERALSMARAAVVDETLTTLHGHRFDL